MAVVYHIPEHDKVGATTNFERRMKQQGLEPKQEYIKFIGSVTECSFVEEELRKYYGYKPDSNRTFVETLNARKEEMSPKYSKTRKVSSSANVGLNEGCSTREEMRSFFNEVGEITMGTSKGEFVFNKPEQFDALTENAQQSKFGSGDFFWNPTQLQTAFDAAPQRQFNECSELEIEFTGVTLDEVFELQKSLQQKFPETEDIGNQTIAETAMAAQRNMHAFMDEVMEYMDAMGGMHDGFKNGAWKYWKQDYQKAKDMKISDLSERDLLELKFEYVDMFHFFINWGLMIGMTGTELIDMYVTKNKENFDRQRRGY